MQVSDTAKYIPFFFPRKSLENILNLEEKENQQHAFVPESEAKFSHFVTTCVRRVGCFILFQLQLTSLRGANMRSSCPKSCFPWVPLCVSPAKRGKWDPMNKTLTKIKFSEGSGSTQGQESFTSWRFKSSTAIVKLDSTFCHPACSRFCASLAQASWPGPSPSVIHLPHSFQTSHCQHRGNCKVHYHLSCDMSL